MTPVHVRGTAFVSTRHFLVERFGPDGLQRVLERLAPAHRAVVAGPLDGSAWYAFEAWTALCEAADREHGRGDLMLCREMGRYAGRKDLGTAFRQLATAGGDPLQLVRHARQFWSLYYDSGSVEIEDEGPGHFDMAVRGFGSPHLAHCLRVAGWIDASIELFRVSGNVDLVSCRALGHPECRFRASWTLRARSSPVLPAVAPPPAGPRGGNGRGRG